jgi:cytochrome oxidase Cu insertion factor (SCO1/SenC/PrrC family)
MGNYIKESLGLTIIYWVFTLFIAISSPSGVSNADRINSTLGGNNLQWGNKVGDLAYDFSMPDLKGNTVTLSGLRGRPVFLNFWYAG